MMDISEWASTSLRAIPVDPDAAPVSLSESNLPRLPQTLVCSGLVIELGGCRRTQLSRTSGFVFARWAEATALSSFQ
jgi:hypothetical protein